jgi:hypothetical protein
MMMLSASEIESLRQETKQAMLEMRAYRHKLAAAKEQQASDEADGRPDPTSAQLLDTSCRAVAKQLPRCTGLTSAIPWERFCRVSLGYQSGTP